MEIFVLFMKHIVQMFPALMQASYKSVILHNTGDHPLIFKWPSDQCSDVALLPPSGFIPPCSHQILTLRSTPVEENPASSALVLQLNASPKHNQVNQ